jgi:hypothetical protein
MTSYVITVMMGVVQLQAAFSVVAPRFIIHPKGSNATRRGTLEQRLHTRYDRFVVCIALHHHHRAALATLNTIYSTLCDLYPYTTVLVQQ